MASVLEAVQAGYRQYMQYTSLTHVPFNDFIHHLATHVGQLGIKPRTQRTAAGRYVSSTFVGAHTAGGQKTALSPCANSVPAAQFALQPAAPGCLLPHTSSCTYTPGSYGTCTDCPSVRTLIKQGHLTQQSRTIHTAQGEQTTSRPAHHTQNSTQHISTTDKKTGTTHPHAPRRVQHREERLLVPGL